MVSGLQSFFWGTIGIALIAIDLVQIFPALSLSRWLLHFDFSGQVALFGAILFYLLLVPLLISFFDRLFGFLFKKAGSDGE
ncbi:hypothetical protein NBRC116594_15040 [Shimia sp. NS0008-38b]|uniref:hypothetical protein n=1 Tax=Shimia sp. NS0008-38b TaxID=3127653 RepID=UPI003108C3FE